MGGDDSSQKKDLTSVLDLSKNYTGPEPGSSDSDDPGGMLMEEKPIEKIDAWESIEEYSAANPVPEAPPEEEMDFSMDAPAEAPPEAAPALPEEPVAGESDFSIDMGSADATADANAGSSDFDFNADASADPAAGAEGMDFGSGLDSSMTSGEPGSEASSELSSEFSSESHIEPSGELNTEPSGELNTEPPFAEPSIGEDSPPPSDFAAEQSFSTLPDSELEPEPEPVADFAIQAPPPEPPSAPFSESPSTQWRSASPPPPQASSQPKRRPDPLPDPSPLNRSVAKDEAEGKKKKDSLTLIRAYAQNLAVGKPAVAAAFPFSLLITGRLNDIEKAKLLDIVATHNMGFSEVDLEPQLDSGHILLPRISEYAGILVIQALRDANVAFQFGPSDSIFATEATASAEDDLISATGESGASRVYTVGPQIAADEIPITTKEFIPGWEYWQIIDTLSVSAALNTSMVEAKRSSEYAEALEGLKRELRLRAYRRRAQGLINFKIQLDALALPTHYRLTLTAAAVIRTEQWVRPEAVEPVAPKPVVDDRMVAELIDPTHKEHQAREQTATHILAPEQASGPEPVTSQPAPSRATPPPPPVSTAVLSFADAKDALSAGPEAEVPAYEPEEDTFVLGTGEMESAEPMVADIGPEAVAIEALASDPAAEFEAAIAEAEALPEPVVHDTLGTLLDAEPDLAVEPMALPPQAESPAEPPQDRAARLREEANQRPPRDGEPALPKPPKPEPPLATKSDGSAMFTKEDATRSGRIFLGDDDDEPSFKGPPQLPVEALTQAEAMGIPEEQLKRPSVPPPPSPAVREDTGRISPPRKPPPPPRKA